MRRAALAAGRAVALAALAVGAGIAPPASGEPGTGTVTPLAGALERAGSAAAAGREDEARSAYAAAVELAAAAGDTAAAARSGANAARLSERAGRPDEARAQAEAALGRAHAIAAPAERAETLLSVGLTFSRLAQTDSPQATGVRPAAPVAVADARHAHEAYAAAAEAAAEAGDLRAQSFAEGFLGSLYEQDGRDEPALEMTRRALLSAQGARAADPLYRWQWQLGRLHRRAGRSDDALASLRAAVRTVREQRQALDEGVGGERFREEIAPVYLALVDLALDSSGRAPDEASRRALLLEARSAVEAFKVAELRDYYRDGCVDALEARARPLEEVSPTAAVIYPILLPDRLEILASLPSGIERVRVDVPAATLEAEVQALRRSLEKRSTREFLPHAQRIHERLLAPLASRLDPAVIDTLVFVPDGVLRTVPLAALHDGERFVIERFAVATTPGLTLTDPRPLDRDRLRILLAGVSAPREGFPALPHVRSELAEIESVFGGTVLLDDDFRAASVAERLEAQSFDVVHIASHGRFASDAERSFVLSGDGRLALEQLEEAVSVPRFRDRPVELLSLTACETAAGDPRSALGLAGIAVKAGARSALGSLWRVDDLAASELMTVFYRSLADPAVSRAEALRRGQRALLAEPRTAHPGYWAPFLLISSWL